MGTVEKLKIVKKTDPKMVQDVMVLKFNLVKKILLYIQGFKYGFLYREK